MVRFRYLVLLLAAALLPGRLHPAESTTLTVLATTDLHGFIQPYDYFTRQPAERGLAKIATLIRRERAANPDALLVDCGDTIQGSPLASLYYSYFRAGRLPLGLAPPKPPFAGDPMMLAMNALGYDAMVLGNHEFNFGLRALQMARNQANFPWLSANTSVEPGAAVTPFEPYLVKNAGGIKVAILGVTTTAIPLWEKQEHYAGYRFNDGVMAAREAMARLKRDHRPDLVIAAVHGGLDRDLKTGERRPQSIAGENMAYQIATEVEGIHAVVFGHSHQEVAGHKLPNGVLLCQPRQWGMSLGRMDFRLERGPEGGWKVTSSSSRLIPVNAGIAADQQILSLTAGYHQATERYLDTPVAEARASLDGGFARIEDSPLVDAIHAVQLHYTGADVSFTALFNPRVKVPQGPVTARALAALYIYDNELYVIQGTGAMVRRALENAARYFLTCPQPDCAVGPLVNSKVMGFNYDMAQGVSYELDLRQPEGQRVRDLRWKGKPLADDQPLSIALNNYRAAGSAGYEMFREAPVLSRSTQTVRDLMVEYYIERKALPERADNNWRIVPEQAVETLRKENFR